MEKIINIQEYQRIYTLLKEFDDEFVPNLSTVKDLKIYAKKLLDYAKIYEIINENKRIGFIAFYLNSKTRISYLAGIVIKKECQHLGFGKKLLELYENISKKEEMDILKLEVYNKNFKAINFYKNYGFKLIKNNSSQTSYMIKVL